MKVVGEVLDLLGDDLSELAVDLVLQPFCSEGVLLGLGLIQAVSLVKDASVLAEALKFVLEVLEFFLVFLVDVGELGILLMLLSELFLELSDLALVSCFILVVLPDQYPQFFNFLLFFNFLRVQGHECLVECLP